MEIDVLECPLTAPHETVVELDSSASDNNKKKQAGYVLATTALMLVPLMIFAAFATDVGAWYVRSQQIQRTVDAAALTAVVWMPNLPIAEEHALEAIRINGYPNAQLVDRATFDAATGPTVDPMVVVERVGDQQVRVDLRANGEVYFGGVVAELADGIGISRFAVSEYVLPVEFGSPTNIIGWGDQIIAGDPVNAWAGIMGYCQPAHFGDVRAAAYREQNGCQNASGVRLNANAVRNAAPNDTSPPVVGNTIANPNHQTEGFYFVVDVPQGRTAATNVWLFDAGYCNAAAVQGNKPQRDSGDVRMDFTLWDGTNTPLDDSDLENPLLYRPGADTSDCNNWTNPPGWIIPIDNVGGVDQNAGRWFVQVQNDEVSPNSYAGFGRGVSYYSVGAWDVGINTPYTCFTYDPAPCVGVYARDQLPVRTAATGDVSEFFLANIDPIHDGKQLELNMYDLGEGMDYVQILDPNGVAVPFTWVTDDPAGTEPTEIGAGTKTQEDCTGLASTVANGLSGVNCLQVGQNGVQGLSGTNWSDGGRFNGRWVTAVIDLDQASYFTGTTNWWKIRYVKKVGVDSNDWTTWEVRVIGDPVRLVD